MSTDTRTIIDDILAQLDRKVQPIVEEAESCIRELRRLLSNDDDDGITHHLNLVSDAVTRVTVSIYDHLPPALQNIDGTRADAHQLIDDTYRTTIEDGPVSLLVARANGLRDLIDDWLDAHRNDEHTYETAEEASSLSSCASSIQTTCHRIIQNTDH